MYKGSFVDGIKEGFGTFVSPSGLEYEGEWKKDEPIGEGKKKWPDGSTYKGECYDGANHGCIPLIDASCWFVQRIIPLQQERRIRYIPFAVWFQI